DPRGPHLARSRPGVAPRTLPRWRRRATLPARAGGARRAPPDQQAHRGARGPRPLPRPARLLRAAPPRLSRDQHLALPHSAGLPDPAGGRGLPRRGARDDLHPRRPGPQRQRGGGQRLLRGPGPDRGLSGLRLCGGPADGPHERGKERRCKTMTTQEMPHGPSASPPGPALARMINGYWLTQMISTATRLGIADALAGGPQTARRLAERCGAHSRALQRLLRALA